MSAVVNLWYIISLSAVYGRSYLCYLIGSLGPIRRTVNEELQAARIVYRVLNRLQLENFIKGT